MDTQTKRRGRRKGDSMKISALKVQPGGGFSIGTIGNDLKSLQEYVGGWIEIVGVTPTIQMVVNEEGKLNGLEPTMAIPYLDEWEGCLDDGVAPADIAVGPVLFVGPADEDGNLTGISDEDMIWVAPRVAMLTEMVSGRGVKSA